MKQWRLSEHSNDYCYFYFLPTWWDNWNKISQSMLLLSLGTPYLFYHIIRDLLFFYLCSPFSVVNNKILWALSITRTSGIAAPSNKRRWTENSYWKTSYILVFHAIIWVSLMPEGISCDHLGWDRWIHLWDHLVLYKFLPFYFKNSLLQ